MTSSVKATLCLQNSQKLSNFAIFYSPIFKFNQAFDALVFNKFCSVKLTFNMIKSIFIFHFYKLHMLSLANSGINWVLLRCAERTRQNPRSATLNTAKATRISYQRAHFRTFSSFWRRKKNNPGELEHSDNIFTAP